MGGTPFQSIQPQLLSNSNPESHSPLAPEPASMPPYVAPPSPGEDAAPLPAAIPAVSEAPSDAGLYVTGIGFWLPTDEAAFFHQKEDKPIRDFRDLTALDAITPFIQYIPPAKDQPEGPERHSGEQNDSLQSSIYRRLVTVFALQETPRYSCVLPIFHPKHSDEDPYAVLFCSVGKYLPKPFGIWACRDWDCSSTQKARICG